MNNYTKCKKWSVWSYKVQLRKRLAVLGDQGLAREGWIIGRFNSQSNKWEYGEVAPLPTFHKIELSTVYLDILNTVRDCKKPQTALVKTVFDIWETSSIKGFVSINGLLSFGSSDTNIYTHTVKIKLGRQALQNDIEWFRSLQKQHPSVQWRIDCNRQWTAHQLQTFWQACDSKSIEYIEDPLENPALIEHFADIPFALDESLIQYHSLLVLPNVVAAIVKPTLHLNWQQLIAQYPTVNCIISSTFESSLGIWGLGQLALNYAPNCIHGLGTLDWFAEDIVSHPLETTVNELSLPLKPPSLRFSKLKWEDGE